MALSAAAGRRAHWDRVAASIEFGSYPLWRLQSDVANRRLVDRWLTPDGSNAVLKTDLFDEIAGEGLCRFLSERFSRVVGIDISPAVVSAARERNPGQLEAQAADVLSLPFADGSFGAIVSNSTLDHLASRPEVLTALDELQRVVQPGGALLVSLDNPANPFIRLRETLPEQTSRAVRRVPYSSGWTCGPAQLDELLREAGFEVEAMTAIVHFPRVLAARLDRLARSERSRERWRSLFLATERLGSLPTRHLTGHFIAALARRPPSPKTGPNRTSGVGARST